MRRDNSELPQNVKALIENMNPMLAIPIGYVQNIPFVGVHLHDKDESTLDESIVCDLSASFLNIDVQDEVVAMAVVQFRLNDRKNLSYVAMYNLLDETQFEDCQAVFASDQFGVMLASNHVHDFVAFSLGFSANFDPLESMKFAKEQASEYDESLYFGVMQAFVKQYPDAATMSENLIQLAPVEKQWYAKLRFAPDEASDESSQ